MATVTTGHESSSTLDPHLFTFKPKLNPKSTEIAQTLLSGFYERQLQHVKRLQEFKEVAASDYRQWYCRNKRQKNQNKNNKTISENKSTGDESLSTDDEGICQTLSAPSKGMVSNWKMNSETCKAHQTNERLERLIRIYESPLPRRPGLPAASIQTRPIGPVPRRSAPPPAPALAPVSAPPPPPPPPLPVSIRPSRRMSPINRSKTPPKIIRQVDSSPKRPIINDTINIERLKLAREEAERAMKEHKIFTIIGPYPALREALRRRGWIEKFDRGLLFPSLHGNKKTSKSDDDDDDDDNDDELGDDDLDESPLYDENSIPPWEENDGYYGLLSRLVKTAAPDLIWSVRASYDTNTLSRDQMVNHYLRNGCFTTKVGLCSSLRNLQWFYSGCADEFYPRCYKLTHDDDKVAFIGDYRLTTCISFLKLVHNRCKGVIEPDMNSILAMSSDNRTDPLATTTDEDQQAVRTYTIGNGSSSANPILGKISSAKKVPSSFVEFALNNVEQFTSARDHEDIDINLNSETDSTDEQWTQFIEQFYAASHSYAEVEGMEKYLNRIDECLKNVEHHWPQYHIDGTRNIWILKPGAKSRGRGIVVYDRLDDILKLCSSTLTNDRKFVVQKYIERPLLIHNTKFDIRQWFLVTDWNPLTIWMFKDCYLRFCTEHFNLATRQQNVHLCNYSIQKHFKNNSNRHVDLPVENMWTNTEFMEKYLRPNKLADKWDADIYPAMKDAIICSMLVAQDTIDSRKSSFELFGADFMLGEDLKPWLIEINCSPTMARCTAVTTEMCDSVLEDTCKVMIDRRYNRTADTGRFELVHKGTPVSVPIYVGMELRVEGKTCKTGRTYNNHSNTHGTHNNKMTTPVSAPPQISSSNDQSAEAHSNPSHSASALDTHNDTMSSNILDKDISLSSDFLTEKNETNDDFQYSFHPNVKSIQNNDTQHKQAKTNSNLITVNSFPIRQLSRSKINDRIPSSKDEIASFDINRLPKLPNRSQHVNRLIKQKLRAYNRKTRLSYQDEQILFSSLIILNPQAVV